MRIHEMGASLSRVGMIALFVLPVVLLSAGGCNKADVPFAPGAASTPLDVVTAEKTAPQEAYAYTPVGKRDPFRPPFAGKGPKTPEPTACNGETLTCAHLDELKVVAIITGIDQPTASVEDPTGKGHTVVIGSDIGKNGGRVVAIAKDSVVVQEEYMDSADHRVVSKVALKLLK